LTAEKQGFVIWLTGLPGSGKTTIAKELAKLLAEKGLDVEVLDGDEMRKVLSPEAGFSREDRERHIRRVAYVASLLAKHGVATIVSLISPYRSAREYARSLTKNFIEVYVKCPLEVCMQRDPKGLYKKALAGEIRDLTGLQDVYEEPQNPEVVVNTAAESAEQCALKILKFLEGKGLA